VPAQRDWGWDYLWGAISTVAGIPLPAAAGGNIGGTGGGFSANEPSPAYQQDVPGTHTYHAVEYLTPENEQLVGKTSLTEPNQWNFSATPTVTEGPASGRAVPDVSADADPYSGYLIYAPSFGDVGHPLLEGGWGGTSFVAPQFSGSTAVIDSLLRHRVGFWNPAIYAFATGPGSPFTPIEQAGTGSDNLYYTGNPGQPYNPGSGLGYPDFGKLAADYASGSRG
jgi:subtilase family serine protease